MGSCRCGVNQETQSSIADFPNLLLNKAQVGFSCQKLPTSPNYCEIVAFFQISVPPYLLQPSTP